MKWLLPVLASVSLVLTACSGGESGEASDVTTEVETSAEPTTATPTTEEPTTDEPTTEEPTEEPTTLEPTEEPTTAEPSSEAPTEEATTAEPTSEESTTDSRLDGLVVYDINEGIQFDGEYEGLTVHVFGLGNQTEATSPGELTDGMERTSLSFNVDNRSDKPYDLRELDLVVRSADQDMPPLLETQRVHGFEGEDVDLREGSIIEPDTWVAWSVDFDVLDADDVVLIFALTPDHEYVQVGPGMTAFIRED